MARFSIRMAVVILLSLTPAALAAPVDLGVARDALHFLRIRHYNTSLDVPDVIRAAVPGLRRALDRQGLRGRDLADIPRGLSEEAALAAFGERLAQALRIAGGRLSEQDLLHAGLRAMFRRVGDGTVFVTPAEREVTRLFNQRRLGGIGVRLLDMRDRWTVTGVAPGGPADQAGVRQGDEIVRIGREDVRGLTLFELRTILLGEAGTSVEVTVRRGSRQLTKTTKRAVVDYPVVEHRMLQDRMAYLKIYTFPQEYPARIREALTALAAGKPRGLIVDLRDAGADPAIEQVDTMSLFFPSGTVVGQTAVRGNSPAFRKTWGTPILTTVPTAVVIGAGTWGAGELAAAAFKEHANAVLVGQRTPGVIEVYAISDLRDGSRIGIVEGHMLSGKGAVLHGRGLRPDIEAREDRALDQAIQTLKRKR